MKWIEILRDGDIALLQSESDTQYTVVSGYDPTQPEDQQWDHGTYFMYERNGENKANVLINALEEFHKKTSVPKYTCNKSKDEILEIIADEFEKVNEYYDRVMQDDSKVLQNIAQGKYEAMYDLLYKLEIYEG